MSVALAKERDDSVNAEMRRRLANSQFHGADQRKELARLNAENTTLRAHLAVHEHALTQAVKDAADAVEMFTPDAEQPTEEQLVLARLQGTIEGGVNPALMKCAHVLCTSTTPRRGSGRYWCASCVAVFPVSLPTECDGCAGCVRVVDESVAADASYRRALVDATTDLSSALDDNTIVTGGTIEGNAFVAALIDRDKRVRAKAIEEAAALLDGRSVDHRLCRFPYAEIEAELCANAIRALAKDADHDGSKR